MPAVQFLPWAVHSGRMKRFFTLWASLAILLSPTPSAAGGPPGVVQAPESLPLIRYIGVEDSGIAGDPVLRHVLERFLGDARDDLVTPGGRTVETVVAALALPAPTPPQYIDGQGLMAFWGCSAPDCGLKAAVILSLRQNTACVFLHHTDLDPEIPATYAASKGAPATATFHAEILEGGTGSDRDRVRDACRHELVYASQRARPQGYWLERGEVTVRPGPHFRPDAELSARFAIWDGHDPNR